MKTFFHKFPLFGIFLFYSVLILPFLGKVHLFDWDEINFAEAAREILVTGNWWNIQIEFWPFWEKPPLFIWMQAVSMQIFGVNEFAARFPNYIIGLFTLWTLFIFVKKELNTTGGLWAVLLYMGAITPQFYFRSGIIDPTFNLFIFLSIVSLGNAISQKKNSSFLFAGVWLGFSVLTKGPVSILLVGLTGLVYQLRYQHHFYKIKNLLWLVVGLISLPSIWLFFQSQFVGFWFVKEFLYYQVDLFLNPVASHGQPFYYHPIVLLIGCFPLLIIALRSLFFKTRTNESAFVQLSRILFWVVLIVFSLVTTKIVHYSSMCYLPAAIIGAHFLMNVPLFNRLQKILFGTIGAIWIILISVLIILIKNPSLKNEILSKIDDVFAVAQLETMVTMSSFAFVLPLLLFFVISLLLMAKNTNGIRTGSALFLMVLVISLMSVIIVPKAEEHLQQKWINHLKTYQGKKVIHLTIGFKSYAHLYYTQHKNIKQAKEASEEILKRMNFKNHTEMDMEKRNEFYIKYRDYLINETKLPITVSMKVPHGNEDIFNGKLKKVFEGNGYVVWERSN
jgi:4-amino-4-deoxy-L-arabinose transferase-like glycosyltransferase